MKILLVSEYYPPLIFGGGEISSKILAESLSKKGLEIHVLTSKHKKAPKYELKNKIKIYRRLKTGLNPNSITENIKRVLHLQKSLKQEIRKLDKKEKYDIIHFLNTTTIPQFILKTKAKTFATYNGYTNFCPKRNLFYKDKGSCSGAKGIKCMICIANSNYIGKVKVSRYLKYNPLFWLYLYNIYKKNNLGIKNISNHIVLSSYIKNLLRKNRIKEENISILTNLVEEKKKSEKYKIYEKGFLISYAGAIEKIKGLHLLIKAVKEIGDEDIKLLIFGDGSQKKELCTRLPKNIKFYGKIPHRFIDSIYSQSDLIVLPTLWPEPFARNLLEATKNGKAIIASKSGGNIDAVEEGKNGYLINPNIREIKEKILTLKNNPKLCKEMGKNSKKIYNKFFSSERIINEIIDLYKR